MKKVTTFLSVCALSTLPLVGFAQTTYEGNVLPADAGWTELKLSTDESAIAGAVSQSIVGNALKLEASGDADKFKQLGWYKKGLGFNFRDGGVIEIKAKVINAEKNGAFNIQGFDQFGAGFRIGIYNDKITESTNPFAKTNVLGAIANNDGAFHVYRIEIAAGSGQAKVYRDGTLIGNFAVSSFKFDNIIENGGFEDGEEADAKGEASYNQGLSDHGIGVSHPDMPDFKSNAIMYRIDNRVAGNEDYVHTGNWSVMLDNNSMPQLIGKTSDIEQAGTRELPVKQDTDYETSITRKRIGRETTGVPSGSGANYWGWRDLGIFWDNTGGTLNGIDYTGQTENPDGRTFSFTWGGMNEDYWQVHTHKNTPPAGVSSMRFEFPSWTRDGCNFSENVIDDVYVWEVLDVNKGIDAEFTRPSLDVDVRPLPSSYTNLIVNGSFEDHSINNDGSEYEWALSEDDSNSNQPFFQNLYPDSRDDHQGNPQIYKENSVWTGKVRLQINHKGDDELGWREYTPWAHSGTSSIRITSQQDEDAAFEFKKELEAGKTYCFNLWVRLPKWGEHLQLHIHNGDEELLNQRIGGGDDMGNHWRNVEVRFTTTEENKTLRMFNTTEDFGSWFNTYFDDLVLYDVNAASTAPSATDPDEGRSGNLFVNGDFEDTTIDNNGNSYAWALASNYSGVGPDNYPVAYSDFWGAYVRLQDQAKNGDIESGWARSGNNSLRVSWIDHNEDEALAGGGSRGARRQNIHMNYELLPNKTYTFVFWVKAARYGDWGDLHVSNGDALLWREGMGRRYSGDWFKQRITFTTTLTDHTLKMYTTFGGWMNFYIDDIALYEEPYDPSLVAGRDDFLFFGKSTGTQNAEVEIESVKWGTLANMPLSIDNNAVATVKNLNVSRSGDELVFNATNAASVVVYNASGMIVSQFELQKETSISLPKGVYIVKATSNGVTETIKAVN